MLRVADVSNEPPTPGPCMQPARRHGRARLSQITAHWAIVYRHRTIGPSVFPPGSSSRRHITSRDHRAAPGAWMIPKRWCAARVCDSSAAHTAPGPTPQWWPRTRWGDWPGADRDRKHDRSRRMATVRTRMGRSRPERVRKRTLRRRRKRVEPSVKGAGCGQRRSERDETDVGSLRVNRQALGLMPASACLRYPVYAR
jgi:hypothetical protein